MFHEKYALENLKRMIMEVKGLVYRELCGLELEIYRTEEPVPFGRRMEGEYRRVQPGDVWGKLFDCAWFHVKGKVPRGAEDENLVYVIDIDGEGLIYDEDGCPVRGITNVSSQFDRSMGSPGKRIVPCHATDVIDFWMDAGCNDLVGKLQDGGRIQEAWLGVCDEDARRLFYDMLVLLTQAETAPAEEPVRYEILSVLQKCREVLTGFTHEEIRRCLEITGQRLAKSGGDGAGMSLTAFGHGHLDLAWFWPLRETRRKGARTFSTALSLMERYPDYHFGASQPQLYQWIKEDYPLLYDKVKAAVASGRWELLGAVWVESDCNLIAGESLVRQLLYGNAFWEKEFGKRSDFAWMPDTFGYSAAMPQILKKSGVSCFSTIKMSWNLVNHFPYTNFRWQGIDGSSVLVHMPPEGNYVSEATAKSVGKAKKVLATNKQFGEALLPFGIGDGGGGPSPCHLEYLQREKNLPGLCPIKQGTMEGFFQRFRQRAEEFPVWSGEMFLERHLGVYTTAARNKKYNRTMELLLRDAEMLSAFALRLWGEEYPGARLEQIWKEVLLYQFHDILPGSSIQRVYRESLERYALLEKEAKELRCNAASALARHVDTGAAEKPLVVFNTLSFPRQEWVECAEGMLCVELPACGYAVADRTRAVVCNPQPAAADTLENEHLRVELLDDGSIGSLYHKGLGRELLAGPSNRLLAYQDVENAWNLQYDYRNTPPKRVVLAQSRASRSGPVQSVVQTYRLNRSEIRLELMLRDGEDFLEIGAWVDWREKDTMLRVRFAPDVRASQAECEIQFGHVRRSLNDNTSWEQAQIEISAHRWIALSEPGLHFALLNDCKYGYAAADAMLEINLLRGTDYPGERIDEGEHTFRYGVYADGRSDLTGVIEQGYRFNVQPLCVKEEAHAGEMAQKKSFLSADGSIFVDGVKKAEDGDALIVRAYEAAGRRSENSLHIGLPCKKLQCCNLMERELEDYENSFLSPFEIRTIYIE